MPERVIILGAGGHARVLADCIRKSGDELFGFLDDGKTRETPIAGCSVLGPIKDAPLFTEQVRFVIGIGDNRTRRNIDLLLSPHSLRWYTAIHPSAAIAADVSLGEGTVVLAQAVVNADAAVGRHCIINSGAIVEHDNRIGDFVHLSPGCALGGAVRVGNGTHIGIGATIRNGIDIGSDCVVGAGAVVVKNIPSAGTYIGVPARRMG